MSNRRARVIWFKLDKAGEKGIHLALPISLHVLRELLDSYHDLATVLCLFMPAKQEPHSRGTLRSGKELTLRLTQLLGSIGENGPYDLLDVSTDEVKVRISVKNTRAQHADEVTAL
ncbi:MAG TPA: hypothetical protein VN369_08055 [Terriglobales bacterium]|nr:hypothetical protein [Terriglobales bacterium]